MGSLTPDILLLALRPKQWLKNLFVAAPLVLAGQLGDASAVGRDLWAVVIFCAASSAGYLLNDVLDRNVDRRHPVKRFRPVASGRLTYRDALIVSGGLGAVAVAGSLLIGPAFTVVVTAYLFVSISYSYVLKHLVPIDVAAVVGGFILRAVGGAVAIAVPISPWLYALTALLSLFLILCKRRSEALGAAGAKVGARAAVGRYAGPLAGLTLWSSAGLSLVGYSLYTMLAKSLPSDHLMAMTIPFVAFGLGRYGFLVQTRGSGSAPEEALLRDRPLLLDIACWAAITVAILYWAR